MLLTRRFLAQCRRGAKKIDHVYNTLTTPITFCELSFDDVPEVTPCRDMVVSVMTCVPNINYVCSVYDTLSIEKDIVESFVSVYKQGCRFDKLSDKEKLMLLLKFMSLFYKTIVVHSPVHEHHTIVLNLMDYLNFVISCY